MVSIRDLLDTHKSDLFSTPDDANKFQTFDASVLNSN